MLFKIYMKYICTVEWHVQYESIYFSLLSSIDCHLMGITCALTCCLHGFPPAMHHLIYLQPDDISTEAKFSQCSWLFVIRITTPHSDMEAIHTHTWHTMNTRWIHCTDLKVFSRNTFEVQSEKDTEKQKVNIVFLDIYREELHGKR